MSIVIGLIFAVKAITEYAVYLFTCEKKFSKTLYVIFKQLSESNRFTTVSFNKFYYLRSRMSVNNLLILGGSSGLVVMGDSSCLRGRGFESWHRKLDGYDIFSNSFVVKIVLLV